MIMSDDPIPAADTANYRGAGNLPQCNSAAALQFAESLVLRLCHDLAGALSTMSNALEMANEEAGAPGEALSIAVEGGAAMTARLRLLRAAWGGGLGAMTMPEIIGLIDGLPAARRLRLEFDLVSESSALPPGIARVILNVLMLAGEGLPHGGVITLSGCVADGIVVMLAGRAACWPPGLPALLAEKQAAWQAIDDPRRLGVALTVLLAAAEDVSLSILMGGPPGAPPPLLVRGQGSGARG